MKIEFVIPIQPRTKKNSPRILWKKADKPFQIKFGNYVAATIGYRPMIIPSDSNEEFEKECLPYLYRVKAETGVIDFPVNVQAHYYRDSHRRVDITNLHSALHDVLVKSGLFLDDNRDIIAATDGSRVFHDKHKPRIEITITELEDYQQWQNTKDKQGNLF